MVASGRDVKGYFFNKILYLDTSDLSYPYIGSLYTLLLIKQIFEEKKIKGSVQNLDKVLA